MTAPNTQVVSNSSGKLPPPPAEPWQRPAGAQAVGWQPSLADVALDAASCGFVITDARRPGNPIIYVNRRFELMTGYRAEEVIGRSCAMLQGEDSEQPGLQSLRDALREGRPCQVTLRNYARDGRRFINELHVAPLLGDDGRPDHFIGVQNDITEQVHAEQRVQEVLERIDEAFITLDSDWRFTYANPCAERLLQRPAAELRGAVIWSLFPEAMGTAAQQHYEQALRGQAAVTFSDYFPHLRKWFEIRAFPLSDGLTVFFRDITRQKDHDARLEYQASHDAGTGLWNQRSLLRELSLLMLEARRQGQAVGVLVLALQGHRELAAHFGHAVAEQLVWELAQRLRRGKAVEVAVARSADDEFTLIVPAADRSALALQAALWLKTLSEPVRISGHSLRAELAAGTAWQSEDGADAAQLLANAKVALAAALAAGPGQTMCFDQGMRTRALRRQQLLDAMRHEHFLTQLELHYQPQVHVASGELMGLEALLRWRSPTLGAVAPSEFIPLAECSELIEVMGRWVLVQVCRQISAWRGAGLAPPPVSINASAREVLRADYAPRLQRTLQDHGLDCSSLCVEVTESVAVDGFDMIQPTLAALSEAGVQVHLDDFGQGYCNLRRLQWLDIHTLKVDRSLIAGLDRDLTAQAMLRAIVELARSLGKRVLVEGMETEDEHAVVRDLGCDFAQGYLFGRPVPAASLVLPQAGSR